MACQDLVDGREPEHRLDGTAAGVPGRQRRPRIRGSVVPLRSGSSSVIDRPARRGTAATPREPGDPVDDRRRSARAMSAAAASPPASRREPRAGRRSPSAASRRAPADGIAHLRREATSAARGPCRSNATPRSRSDTQASWPMTTWSRTSTSSSRPAAIASAVRWRSSGLGVGSPDGWLWHEDDAGRVEPDGVAEQLPDPHQRRGDVAHVDGRHALDDVLRVEAQHPQLLALEAAHLDEQAVRDVARRPDRPAPGRPVRDRPPAELERGREPRRLRDADARDRRELRVGGPGERRRGSACRASTSSASSIALRPPAPVPSTTAMSSAAESPPGPRRASRSRGRSAAGRSRTDRRRRARMGLAERSSTVGRRASPSPTCSSWRAGPCRGLARRRARRPRVRTTEARRFPPPSGSGNTTKPTRRPLPGDSPGDFAARLPRASRLRGRREAAARPGSR